MRGGLRALARDVVGGLRRHDMALYAGGLTFYGGIALLPTTLVALWLTRLVLGSDWVEDRGADVAAALPDDIGAPDFVRELVAAGSSLGWTTALIAVIPATLYGEGLRRSFVRLEDHDDSHPGWRGRVALLPLIAFTPVMVAVVLLTAPLLADLTNDGFWEGALAVYLALCLDWLLLTPPMTYVLRVLAPHRPPWPVALLAGTSTAAFVAGFLQGFVLFLALPLDLGVPFGGQVAVGAVVAVAFWLWLLHLVVLVAHGLSLALTRRATDRWRAG